MNTNPFKSPLPPPKPPQDRQPNVSKNPPQAPVAMPSPTLPLSPQPNSPPPPLHDDLNKDSKSKRRLAIAIAVLFLLIIGVVSLFVWYTNPSRIVRNALMNATQSPTSIVAARFENVTDNDDKILVNFDSKTDNPNLAGQFDIEVKLELEDFNLDLDGSWIAAKNGAIYVKLSNMKEAYRNFYRSGEGKRYLADREFRSAVIRFIKQVDGRWVKLDAQKIAQGALKARAEERSCYQKVLSSFYQNSDQQAEISDIFDQNRFIIASSDSMAAGLSDATYRIKYDVAKSYDFMSAASRSKLASSLNDCGEDEIISNDKKPSAKNIKKIQKNLDSFDVKLGITGMNHNLTSIKVDQKTEGNGSFTADIKTDFTKDIAISPPKKALSMKKIQKELEIITSKIINGNFAEQGAEE